MKKFMMILAVLFFTTSVFAQWQLLNSGTTAWILDGQFINNSTGYMVSSGYGYTNSGVLKTTNSGINWFTILSGPNGFEAVCFTSPAVGYVARGLDTILQTTNSGLTWNVVLDANEPNQGFKEIIFVNESTGYAAGVPSYKTTNGGLNWFALPNGSDTYHWSITFSNPSTGYAAGRTGWFAKCFKTINGGASWQPFSILDNGMYIFVHKILSYNSLIYAVGNNTVNHRIAIFTSSDQGANWISLLNSTVQGDLLDIRCSGNLIYAAGIVDSSQSAVVVSSSNGGISWTEELLPVGMINTIAITGSDVFIGSKVGEIMKKSFLTGIPEEEIPSKFELLQNYPNPFNPSTTISYSIPKKSHVEIRIYDISGKEIDKVVSGIKEAGNHNIAFDGSKLASGVYFYKLSAGSFTSTKKMILVK